MSGFNFEPGKTAVVLFGGILKLDPDLACQMNNRYGTYGSASATLTTATSIRTDLLMGILEVLTALVGL